MLRLKLEYFEVKTDEQGYAREFNRQDCVEVVVEDSSDSDRLLAILTQYFKPKLSTV